MFLSKLLYLYIVHCFTHILAMVQLAGILSQTKIGERFLSFKNMLSPYEPLTLSRSL